MCRRRRLQPRRGRQTVALRSTVFVERRGVSSRFALRRPAPTRGNRSGEPRVRPPAFNVSDSLTGTAEQSRSRMLSLQAATGVRLWRPLLLKPNFLLKPKFALIFSQSRLLLSSLFLRVPSVASVVEAFAFSYPPVSARGFPEGCLRGRRLTARPITGTLSAFWLEGRVLRL